jgi:hypothetical protein
MSLGSEVIAASAAPGILDAVADLIDKRISELEHEKAVAMEEARYHKGAMESRYDTFKEEAQYLAGAFQKKIDGLSAGKAALLSDGAAKAFVLSRGAERKTVLVSPVLGGETVVAEGGPVQLVSAGSEMGRILSAVEDGDEAMGWRVESVKTP